MKTCPSCNSQLNDNARFCPNCGYNFSAPNPGQFQQQTPNNLSNNAFDPCGPEGKVRGIFAIFAFFLGTFGLQYFYVGKNTAGIISILISLCTCGLWGIIVVIQAILVLMMSNQEFRAKFVTSNSTFPVF